MTKKRISALLALAAGTLAMAPAPAQQSSSAPQSSSSTASQSSTPKTTAKAPAAKRGVSATSAKKAQAPLVLTTDKDKASYAIGLNMGKSMHRESVDIDPDILLRGLRDGLNDSKTPLLTDDEARAAVVALQNEVRKAQQEKQQALAESNKKAGDAFLAENKTKEGVVVLPSGLQYKILQEGNGPKPAATDTVVCNYKGTLLDNTEFDSSAKQGPATFQVNRVIKGWTEALQLMPVGSKWQLFIPPDLAYGPRGGGPIGPNATLVFEVELVSIQPKPEPNSPSPQPNPKPATNPSASPAPGTNASPAPNASPNPPPKPNPTPPPTPTPTPTPTHYR